MNNTSTTIIFFGTDSFSVSALEHLIEAGYPIAAVITKPDSKSGRGQKLTPPDVKVMAQAHGIPVWQPTRLLDCLEDLKALGPVTGVLSSYGKIVPQAIIDCFTPGILNIHPSLLPAYRGPSPIETAILNGDDHTGVSLMLLNAEMDAGPLYAQATYPLTGNETQPELYIHLADLGSSLLLQHLPHILDGELTPTDQTGEVSYSQLLQKSESTPDPAHITAEQLERKIRAHLAFPKTKLTFKGQLLTVTAGHVSDEPEHAVSVQCQDGRYLVVDSLIAPSGRRMSATDYLNGYA